MPVSSMELGSRIQLRVNLGFDNNGRPVLRSRNYSNVKPSANDEDVYNVAQGIAELQDHTLEAIYRINEVMLTEE